MKYLKSFGLLILRISIGAMLIHHGYEKLENIPNFSNAFVKPWDYHSQSSSLMWQLIQR